MCKPKEFGCEIPKSPNTIIAELQQQIQQQQQQHQQQIFQLQQQILHLQQPFSNPSPPTQQQPSPPAAPEPSPPIPAPPTTQQQPLLVVVLPQSSPPEQQPLPQPPPPPPPPSPPAQGHQVPDHRHLVRARRMRRRLLRLARPRTIRNRRPVRRLISSSSSE